MNLFHWQARRSDISDGLLEFFIAMYLSHNIVLVQGYNTMILYLYIQQNDHQNKSSYHLSPCIVTGLFLGGGVWGERKEWDLRFPLLATSNKQQSIGISSSCNTLYIRPWLNNGNLYPDPFTHFTLFSPHHHVDCYK